MKSYEDRKLYTLYKSSNRLKKFDVYVENPLTDKIKKVSFGAKNYEDYTIHKDKERREKYRQRHSKDKIDNHLYPGFWSWHVLWGKYSSLDKSMRYTVKNLHKLSKI